MARQLQTFSNQFPIVLRQEVIWGDMDAFEHVNNTVYFRYFEDARLKFFEAVGILEHKAASGIGPILASTHCNFKLPLKYPDTVQIGGRAKIVSPKKIQMEYAVYSEGLSALVAEGEGLLVYYNYNNQRSCEIPDSIITAIEDLSKSIPSLG